MGRAGWNRYNRISTSTNDLYYDVQYGRWDHPRSLLRTCNTTTPPPRLQIYQLHDRLLHRALFVRFRLHRALFVLHVRLQRDFGKGRRRTDRRGQSRAPRKDRPQGDDPRGRLSVPGDSARANGWGSVEELVRLRASALGQPEVPDCRLPLLMLLLRAGVGELGGGQGYNWVSRKPGIG